jgi:hypothetical protein
VNERHSITIELAERVERLSTLALIKFLYDQGEDYIDSFLAIRNQAISSE